MEKMTAVNKNNESSQFTEAPPGVKELFSLTYHMKWKDKPEKLCLEYYTRYYFLLPEGT